MRCHMHPSPGAAHHAADSWRRQGCDRFSRSECDTNTLSGNMILLPHQKCQLSKHAGPLRWRVIAAKGPAGGR